MDSLPSTLRVLGCFAACILAWAVVEAGLAGLLLLRWPLEAHPPTRIAVIVILEGYLSAGVAALASIKWAYR